MDNKKLKILIVTQYFWPENMRINDLVEGFTKKGHEVTVLTGIPNYPEGHIFTEYKKDKTQFNQYGTAQVIRVPMFARGKRSLTLILNYCSFFISASTFGLLKLRGKSFDAIFVYAVSPISAAIPANIIGRFKSAPVFLWVLDLWPETLSAVGAVKNPRILNSVGRMVSWIYNRTDYILFQSKSFKASILNYCTKTIDDKRLIYFPSWSESVITQCSDAPHNTLLKKDNTVFTILFAGNIGESQDFPAIVDGLTQLNSNKNIRLVIVGDGGCASWVNEQISQRKLKNIIMLGRHPVSDMPGLFACADALLVSLKKSDIFAKTIPGKLQAYLSSGKPILGMIDGEAAEIITESGGGVVGPAGNVQVLVNNISLLAQLSSEQLEQMGQNGLHYYNKHFQAQSLFSQLEQLMLQATLRIKKE